MIPGFAELGAKMQARQWAVEARRKAARLRPNGTYRKRASRNRLIAEGAIVREPIPNSHAEIWITYGGGREEFQSIRKMADASPEFAEHFKFTLEICDPDALNGYVAFDKRHAPRLPVDYGGLVKYIPVHGGCTYATKDSCAAVWGFDSNHFDSEKQPRTEIDWAHGECLILYEGLRRAEALWPEFRRASRDRQIEIAQSMVDLLPGTPAMSLGMGAILSMMSGEV